MHSQYVLICLIYHLQLTLIPRQFKNCPDIMFIGSVHNDVEYLIQGKYSFSNLLASSMFLRCSIFEPMENIILILLFISCSISNKNNIFQKTYIPLQMY